VGQGRAGPVQNNNLVFFLLKYTLLFTFSYKFSALSLQGVEKTSGDDGVGHVIAPRDRFRW